MSAAAEAILGSSVSADLRHVYFVQAEHGGPVKIGVAKDPEARLRDLQIASPYKLCLLRVEPGGRDHERALHARFSADRLCGEWFMPNEELAIRCSARIVDGANLEYQRAMIELARNEGAMAEGERLAPLLEDRQRLRVELSDAQRDIKRLNAEIEEGRRRYWEGRT